MKVKSILCIAFAAAGIAFLASCRKEESIPDNKNTIPNNTTNSKTYTTVFPRNYYPVYPKSWWTYLINGTTIKTDSVSLTYLPNAYINNIDSFGIYPISDTMLVPYLNGQPIYGYNKLALIRQPFGGYYQQWPIVSEVVGYTYKKDWEDPRWGNFAENLVVDSKTLVGNDSVILVKGYWVHPGSKNINNTTWYRYVKNVGLKSYYKTDNNTHDTIFRQELINYYINK